MDVPDELYHVTLGTFLPSILNKGLIPNGGVVENAFSSMPNLQWPCSQKYVYLANKKIAFTYGGLRRHEFRTYKVLLKIKTSFLDKTKIFSDINHHGCFEQGIVESYQYDGIVPPEAITVEATEEL